MTCRDNLLSYHRSYYFKFQFVTYKTIKHLSCKRKHKVKVKYNKLTKMDGLSRQMFPILKTVKKILEEMRKSKIIRFSLY